MMTDKKYYMVGNWKMNQDTETIKQFFKVLYDQQQSFNCHGWIAPQFIHIPLCQELSQKYHQDKILIGAQNCSDQVSGAFTGEISPTALRDLGVSFVIVGHSERRHIYMETHKQLNQKLHTALKSDLKVIFCVGETLEQREANKTQAVIAEQLSLGLKQLTNQQLSQVLIAYEPVWAIGTGKTAGPEQAQEVHSFIRGFLSESWGGAAQEIPLLYGGSVKPENVVDLLNSQDINGALVGGASLDGQSFRELCRLAAS